MLYVYLHSQVRPILGMMVRVCSVWPTLSIWCIKFGIHFLQYVAYSKTLFISELIELNVCLSSFTGASNHGNDGASVFSVAYSKHLVHKIWD